jgi:rubrerythrin
MKDNILIAEFMGVDYVDIDTYLETNKELPYHTSWDWLMPVAEKIYKERGLDDEIILMIRDSVAELNIESMYKVIVKFINEHNKYICGSCGDHVNEVVFNEDSDVDECTSCIQ